MVPFSTYTSSFPSYQQQSITIHTESLFFDPLMFSLFSSDQNVGRWWKSPIWHQQIFRNPEERPPVSGNMICIFICIRYMEDAKPRHLLLMRDHCIWKFLSWSETFLCLLSYTSTWPFSSLLAEVLPHFLSLQARSHFHAACCFAHNYCTTFLT